MGMFDHVLIEGHGLPGIDPERLERAHRTEKEGGQEDLAGKLVVFQTKDLENYLGTYVIKDGRLHERIYEHEDVPEEERPYYGKPEWDGGGTIFGKDFYRRSGSKRIVGHRDEDLEYHGDLVFYATDSGEGFRWPGGSQPRKDQTRSYPRSEAILSSGTSRAASETGLLKSGASGSARAARS